MTAAGMDTSVTGGNVDLNDPIGHALRDLGYTVDSVVLVADADVDDVTDSETDEYLGLAELHTLEAVLGNLDDVDIKVGPMSESLSQLAERVERKISRLRAQLERDYGYGLSVIGTGYIQLNRAEHD